MEHWNENDFKQWLYGLKAENHHLEECPECRGEMDRLREAAFASHGAAGCIGGFPGRSTAQHLSPVA